MTVTINLPTIAEQISRLSVEGVTILDIDAITTQYILAPYTLAPRPDGWFSNLSVTVDTFGTLGTEKLTMTYNLTYRYFHTALGNQLNFASYSHMIDNIVNIAEVILTNDTVTGAIDLRLAGISDIGPVSDPAGNQYHGCDFTLLVTEYPA